MLPNFMQCLLFALIQLITSYLFETIFIFPQHSPSCEACMIYPDSYWLNAYQLPFVGVSIPLWLGAWDFLSDGDKN